MVNFRDVSTGSNGKICQGALFRSAGPLYGAHIGSFGKGTWIDLRTADEYDASALSWDLNRISVPLQINDNVFRAIADPSSEDWIALYCRATERLLPDLVQITRHVITEKKPILISCSAGKDRTGIAIAFLLYLAGIEQSTIVKDYCKTAEVAAQLCQKHLPRLRNRGLSDAQLVQAYFVARADVIIGLLKHFEEKRNEIFAALAINGLAESDLEKLRRFIVG